MIQKNVGSSPNPPKKSPVLFENGLISEKIPSYWHSVTTESLPLTFTNCKPILKSIETITSKPIDINCQVPVNCFQPPCGIPNFLHFSLCCSRPLYKMSSTPNSCRLREQIRTIFLKTVEWKPGTQVFQVRASIRLGIPCGI